jgi:hypothetical protein
MSIEKIIGIFVCFVLLFSCNKNNKSQDSNLDNSSVEEQIENNETIIAEISDDYLEYDASENDINSPYSDFFYNWKYYYETEVLDPVNGIYLSKLQEILTITGKSIKYYYNEKTEGDMEIDVNSKWNIENITWEPITIQEARTEYQMKLNSDAKERISTEGYKITGTFKLIEKALHDFSPPPPSTWYVFFHKDDPSILFACIGRDLHGFDEYHRIDRKKN